MTSLASASYSNWALKLVDRLVSPRSAEDYVRLFKPTWSASRCLAQIVDVNPEATDCVSLTLAPNAHWQGHRAGQYVPLTVEVNGRRLTRCFTISQHSGSDQANANTITLTIKLNGEGLVSRWAQTANIGEIVELGQPAGDFVLPADTRRSLLFIAGGSGITPVRAMVDAALAAGWQGTITVLHYTPDYSRAIFRSHLLRQAYAHGNLHVLHAITRKEATQGDLQGHFCPTHLNGLRITHSDIYVCGPETLMQSVTNWAAEQRLSSYLHREHFITATPQAREGFSDTTVQVGDHLIDDNLVASLLARLELAGEAPKTGCRIGICHTCTCTKKSGIVRDMVTGELSGAGVENIRLCVSQAITDIELIADGALS